MSRTNVFGDHAPRRPAISSDAETREANWPAFTLSEQDARPMTGIINGTLLGIMFQIAVLTVVVILRTLG
jgi:hypothetical protein